MHAADIGWLGPAILIVVIGGPIALAVLGLLFAERSHYADRRSSPLWFGLTVNSAMLYALAFNLTFFVQELFLVVPKALTPGLRPVLYHNNHTWAGSNPLEDLFQGTGALAIFIMGLAALVLLGRVRKGGLSSLFLCWLAYHGLMQSMPQIPSALLEPDTDVGRAFFYLQISGFSAAILTLAAFAGIALVPQWLTPALLAQAREPSEIAGGWRRTVFAFKVATLPAVLGTLLVIPFRLPGEVGPVLISPVLIAAIGISWIQAGAWGAQAEARGRSSDHIALAPMLALVALFLFFQMVLARGVPFY